MMKRIAYISLSLLLLILIFTKTLSIADDYYASPSGSGTQDGSSPANSYQINDFWDDASAGDTLNLADGVYTGSNSVIDPPDDLNGTLGNEITVKATNDGQVEIDCQGAGRAVYLYNNDYFIIEGMNAHSSQYEVVNLSTGADNNIIRRVIAWDAAITDLYDNRHVFASHYGTDNLFEDCAGWGTGRKIFSLYNDTRTTWRRCYANRSGSLNVGWKLAITIGYTTITSLTENCIVTWDLQPGYDTTQQSGMIATDNYGTGPMRILGCIGYYFNEQGGAVGSIFRDSASYTTDHKDLVAYSDSGINISHFSVDTGRGTNRTGAKGTEVNIDGAGGFLITDLDDGTDLLQYDATTRPSSGAWIRNRYVDGTLTGDALWPWPMNDRIEAAMISSGYSELGGLDGSGETDLTKLVFEMGGGTEPDWGGPAPDTEDPTVPTNLNGTAVSDTQIDLTWTASTDNVGVVAYKIFRDAVNIDSIGVETTAYSDTGLIESTTYTHTVSAIDAASNESAESTGADTATLGDTTSPTISSVSATSDTTVKVVFSEPVELVTAETSTNYTITGDTITVSAAILQPNLTDVVLTCTPLSTIPTYTVHVWNVKDRSPNENVITADSQSAFTWSEQLLLWLKFEEHQQDLVVSAGDSTATLGADNNAASDDPVQVIGAGPLGNGLYFDGSDLVQITNASELDSLTDITVMVWFNADSAGGAGFGRMLSKEDTGTDDFYYHVESEFLGGVACTIFNAADDNTRTDHNDITLVGVLYHAVYVFDNSTKQGSIYLNGVEVSTYTNRDTMTGNPKNSVNPFVVGNRSSGGRGFEGTIYDLKVYGIAVGADDIADEYNAGIVDPSYLLRINRGKKRRQ